MDARSVDLRTEEGIMAERCGMTIARRERRLPLAARRARLALGAVVDAVRNRRQRGQQKDDQDDEEDSAHRPFQGAIYEREKRCEVPLSEAAKLYGQRYSYEAKSH
jgi:hypothetical protein